jgi:hypothetical protein
MVNELKMVKAGRPRIVDGKKIPVTLTPEEEEWNRKISLVRGKIEAPYGWVKRVLFRFSFY